MRCSSRGRSRATSSTSPHVAGRCRLAPLHQSWLGPHPDRTSPANTRAGAPPPRCSTSGARPHRRWLSSGPTSTCTTPTPRWRSTRPASSRSSFRSAGSDPPSSSARSARTGRSDGRGTGLIWRTPTVSSPRRSRSSPGDRRRGAAGRHRRGRARARGGSPDAAHRRSRHHRARRAGPPATDAAGCRSRDPRYRTAGAR